MVLGGWFQNLECMCIQTGLPTKDEPSETIVRILFFPYSHIMGTLSAKTGLFPHLIFDQTIKVETKNQA